MITRERTTREQTYLEVTDITCDICGKDAHGITGVGSPGKVCCGRFERRERNTEENQIDPHAFINEWPISRVADLCDSCAAKVQGFIDAESKKHKRKGSGTRRPNELGD